MANEGPFRYRSTPDGCFRPPRSARESALIDQSGGWKPFNGRPRAVIRPDVTSSGCEASSGRGRAVIALLGPHHHRGTTALLCHLQPSIATVNDTESKL